MSILRTAVLMLLAATVAFAQTSASKTAPKSDKSGGASLQATLEKLERAGWEAFKTRDQNAFRQLCAPEYTAVEADQGPPRDLPAALASMKDFDLHSYALSELKATALGPDAALLTYVATINLTMEGKPQDVKLAVTSVYVKRGGQWKDLRYHESAIK